MVNADGTASFEIDMDLLEPSSRIFLYKVSVKTHTRKEYLLHRTAKVMHAIARFNPYLRLSSSSSFRKMTVKCFE